MTTQKNGITICRSTRRNLRYILLWPGVNEELKPSIFYSIKIVVYVLITAILPLSMLMHLIITYLKNLNVSLVDNFSLLASMTGVYYMTFVYIKHRLKVAKLLKEMSDFENFGKPPNFEQKERILNIFSTFVFVYLSFIVLQYDLLKFLGREECEKKNRNEGLNENCGFFSPIWTPFSTKNPFIYYSVQVYIIICTQLLMKPSALITYHEFEIAEHLILRIKHLNQMIRETFDNAKYEIARNMFTNCAIYHADIIRMAKALDGCFSNSMFAHTCITAISFACIEKEFVEGNPLCAVLHFSGWLVTLAFACFSGQILINASESISGSIWFSKWYEADLRLQKDILFMLVKSQKIFTLTAGPFSTLSFPLLVSVVKMSYSLFCLLSS